MQQTSRTLFNNSELINKSIQKRNKSIIHKLVHETIGGEEDINDDVSEEQLYTKLQKILQKPSKTHTFTQKNIVNIFLKKNSFFKFLSQTISPKFAKNILKESRMVLYENQGHQVFQQGEIIHQFGVVIEGKLAIYHKGQLQQDRKPQNFQQIHDLWKQLKERAQKANKRRLKKALSLVHGFTQPNNLNILNIQEDKEELKLDQVSKDKQFGLMDYYFSHQRFIFSYKTAKSPTRLLLFNLNKMLFYLNEAMKIKIKTLTQKLKQIQCFSVLQHNILTQIIKIINLKSKKRGSYIFQQGQKTQNFYILEQGQVRLFKSTDLFEQNPNELYFDRKKLIQQNYIHEKSQKIHKNPINFKPNRHQRILLNEQINKSTLPYADFKTMYNYIPMKKNIDIGIVTNFCLFGQQEFISKKNRENYAICQSLQCLYYEINIKKCQEILGQKGLQIFIYELRNMLRSKILFRQKQFANKLQFQNINNMKYFYDNENQKAKKQPMRLKLQKINNNLQKFAYYSEQRPISRAQNMNSRLSETKKNRLDDLKTNSVPPSYDKFNFQTILRRKKSKKQGNSKEHSHYIVKHRKQEQINIMNNTHTWSLIRQKVAMQSFTSKKISPKKHKITIKRPLIQTSFILDMERKTKKLERSMRMGQKLQTL